MSSKKNFYVNPRRFTELLIAIQDTNDEESTSALLVECIYPLCAGVCRRYKLQYMDEEDVIQNCVMHCWKNIHKFNINKKTVHNELSSNDPYRKAFSFFTSCAANVIKGMYRSKQKEIEHNVQMLQEAYDEYSTWIDKNNKE